MSERRLTPANTRVAHRSLQGKIAAVRFVDGDWARVSAPIADLLAAPNGPRDRQVIMGDRVLVLDRHAGFAFVQAEKDRYCGYLPLGALGDDHSVSHWVSAPATHLYSEPDLKKPEIATLSLGSRLNIVADHPRFYETATGLFVPRPHLRPIGEWHSDPVAVAESLLGTPYLWGGNTRAGIDCSGLVQACLLACGIACPADTDMQMAAVGRALPVGAASQRGDLLFWKGHEAMVVDGGRIIHANGFHMAVRYEDTAAAIARIEAQGEGRVLAVRRL